MATACASSCLRLPQGATSAGRPCPARASVTSFRPLWPLCKVPSKGFVPRGAARRSNRAPTHVTAAMPAFDVGFAVLPNLVPILLRATTAGVLFYASMNWVFYRGQRKDAEKGIEKYKEMEEERKEKLKRLGPSDDK